MQLHKYLTTFSLLPILSKVFEKLLVKRLKPLIEYLLPDYQFCFRNKRSTNEQIHRIVNKIEQNLEESKICGGVILNVSEAFDRVWHPGILF